MLEFFKRRSKMKKSDRRVRKKTLNRENTYSSPEMREPTLSYPGTDIEVLFTVNRCTHVGACLRGAPAVFDLSRKVWVKPEEASADRIAEVIERCPTGALHYVRKDDGNIELYDYDGTLLLKDTRLALCRCGASKTIPLCDGSHALVSFKDSGPLQQGKVAEIRTGEVLKITLEKDGPLALSGPVEIKNEKDEILYRGDKSRLCRCGRSQHMVFCDGSHNNADFSTEKIRRRK